MKSKNKSEDCIVKEFEENMKKIYKAIYSMVKAEVKPKEYITYGIKELQNIDIYNQLFIVLHKKLLPSKVVDRILKLIICDNQKEITHNSFNNQEMLILSRDTESYLSIILSKANSEYPIYPPYEAFYLENLVSVFTMIENSIIYFETEIKAGDLVALLHLRNIISGAGLVSKYFFPATQGNALYKNRAIFLRNKFNIDDGCILRNRKLRNALEHFDEKLDDYLSISNPVGVVIPRFVLTEKINTDVPMLILEGYIINTDTYMILDKTFEIKPIVKELKRVRDKVCDFVENGGRFI